MQSVPRRDFMIATAIAAATTSLNPARAQTQQASASAARPVYPFAVPDLPYGYDRNEPSIDRQTMELHHDKHHVAYVANLNAALKDQPEAQALPLRHLLRSIPRLPEAIRATVRNNAGGHANHTMLWEVMGGGGGEPTGVLAAAVTRDFGSSSAMRESFNKAAASVFGSGWAMVLTDETGKLSLVTRPNQDSPLMNGIDVVFGNDVWEHAYYLKFQNRRSEYLAAWWNVLDWDRIGQRYLAAKAGTLAV